MLLVLIDHASAQSDGVLDRLLAEADDLVWDRPRQVAPEFRALRGSRRLMGAALVDPRTARRLAKVLADPGASLNRRAYAAYLLTSASGFRVPPYAPDQAVLERTYRETRHPALRVTSGALLLGYRHSLEEKRRLWGEIRHGNGGGAGPTLTAWHQQNSSSPMTFPADRELAREILVVLPAVPELRPRANMNEDSWDLRFIRFFGQRQTQPGAIEVLANEYASASAARRFLFLWAFGTYTSNRRIQVPEALRARLIDLARRWVLSSDSGSIRAPFNDPGIDMLSESGTNEDARTLLATARSARDPVWRKQLLEAIRYLWVEPGRWPKELSLDGLYPGGAPKKIEPPKPEYRKRPEKLIRDPHPWLRDKSPRKESPR